MFGKLAKFLRMAGYDTAYVKHNERDKLVKLGVAEQRVIITKDPKIKTPDTRVYFLSENMPEEQIKKVTTEFNLDYKNAFTLCVNCNKPLIKVEKEKAKDKIPAKVYASLDEFYTCKNCGRVFWHGTHYVAMREKLKRLMG